MNNTITYKLDSKLYINLTNKCNNNCKFCVRNHSDGVGGHKLWLEREPAVKEVIESIQESLEGITEVVFCGFGEPLYRLDAVIVLCDFLQTLKIPTRLNTNGGAKFITGKNNIAKTLSGKLSAISISLNEVTAKDYYNLCEPKAGIGAFKQMLKFAKQCTKYIDTVVLSVVDTLGDEKIEKAKKIANKIGAKLRVRQYI